MTKRAKLCLGIKKTLTALGCMALLLSAIFITVNPHLSQFLGIFSALVLLVEKIVPAPHPVMTVKHVLHLVNLADGTETIKGGE